MGGAYEKDVQGALSEKAAYFIRFVASFAIEGFEFSEDEIVSAVKKCDLVAETGRIIGVLEKEGIFRIQE